MQVLVFEGRCWSGYRPVKGKKPFSKNSCKKEGILMRAIKNISKSKRLKK